MPSQFFGLNIAYTGLLNANAGLNTTANNISNAETEGYSRQGIHSEAAEALRVFTTYGCAGAGVETLSIERIHDEFYDNKYWDNNDKTGQYHMKDYYMKQIEDYFRDDSTIEGFTTTFNKMMTALAEVKKNPANISTKAQFVGMADSLCEYFNSMAASMEQVQKDANSEIKLKVDEINSIASELATINKQINVIEIGGGTANELRDKRTLLVDQLSAIVSVEAREYPIVDSNDPERETGGNMYIVKIAGGQVLVDTDRYNTLECLARTSSEKNNQSDIDGLYDVYWISDSNHAVYDKIVKEGKMADPNFELEWNDFVKFGYKDGKTEYLPCSDFNLYNASLGGQLQGLIQIRDGNNGENFSGKVDSIVSKESNEAGDRIAKVRIKVDKNLQSFLTDLNKTTLSDTGGIITFDNKKYYFDDWKFECVSNGTEDTSDDEYYYTISVNETKSQATVYSNIQDAVIGSSIKYQGVPYYQQQLNEWCRIFSAAFNNILMDGYTSEGDKGVQMFVANKALEGQYEFKGALYGKYVMKDGSYVTEITDEEGTHSSNVSADGSYTVDMSQDSYYWMTAKNMDILKAIVDDPGKMATKSDAAAGADEYNIVGRLIDMTMDKDVASYRGAATQEFLTCVLSDVALNAKNAATFYNNYQNIGKNIDNQRISISGVDTDDEAVSLIKYQNAYTLASKMIQTLTEVYDRLILETGV